MHRLQVGQCQVMLRAAVAFGRKIDSKMCAVSVPFDSSTVGKNVRWPMAVCVTLVTRGRWYHAGG